MEQVFDFMDVSSILMNELLTNLLNLGFLILRHVVECDKGGY